jgi:hypothetical protein
MVCSPVEQHGFAYGRHGKNRLGKPVDGVFPQPATPSSAAAAMIWVRASAISRPRARPEHERQMNRRFGFGSARLA